MMRGPSARAASRPEGTEGTRKELSMNRRLATILFAALAASPGCASMMTDEGTAAPAMTEEQMMARMMELATPGEGHARLQAVVGTFKTKGTFWMAPDTPPTISDGSSTNTWVLGGRYVKQEYKGDFDGQPFEGLGFTGFNNASGQYESTWMDSASTFIMPLATGTTDASGRVTTYRRERDDPMTGLPTKSREVITIHNDNRHTFEWYEMNPDGSEWLMMRMEYTRTN
jgi:hypothetical protein